MLFPDLDDEVRTVLLEEIRLDQERDKLHQSNRLSRTGWEDWPLLLAYAAENGAGQPGRGRVSFLLDTNVVSEIRKKTPDPGVSAWFASVPADELFLSVLVVGEKSSEAETEGPQVVTGRCEEVAVSISMAEYRRLDREDDFKAFLRSAPALDLEIDRSAQLPDAFRGQPPKQANGLNS